MTKGAIPPSIIFGMSSLSSSLEEKNIWYALRVGEPVKKIVSKADGRDYQAGCNSTIGNFGGEFYIRSSLEALFLVWRFEAVDVRG